MADFYIDHNVSLHTASALRRHGHDVLTSRQMHQTRAPDYRQVITAANAKRILISHDEEDFTLLHGAWLIWSAAWESTVEHAGILIIPQRAPEAEQWGPESAARELTSFVGQSGSLANRLCVWRRSAGWLESRVADGQLTFRPVRSRSIEEFRGLFAIDRALDFSEERRLAWDARMRELGFLCPGDGERGSQQNDRTLE